MRVRFWVESALASLTALLTGVTLVWHEWIEAFGVDPDHGDGTWEWASVLVLATVCVVLTVTARWEYRRSAPAKG